MRAAPAAASLEPSPGATAESDPIDARTRVLDVLERLSERGLEQALCERFYPRFFADCPEAVPLFGVHAIAEREEMVQETLRSLLARCEDASWLDENLRALGASHAEYGVAAEMYPIYVSSFLATLREILGEELCGPTETALRGLLAGICGVMCEAGEQAAARRPGA